MTAMSDAGVRLDYYTALRAARAFVKIAAAGVAPEVRGVAHDQYAWRHPAILRVITRAIESVTGFRPEPPDLARVVDHRRSR